MPSDNPHDTDSLADRTLRDGLRARYRLPDASRFVDVSTAEQAAELRDYLRASLQMQHLVLLCGSGTSTESGGPSMSRLWEVAHGIEGFRDAQARINYENGSDIEEFLSRCDAYIELNDSSGLVYKVRKRAVEIILDECRKPGASASQLVAHADLLKKVTRRRARDSRIHLFTTNYDLCFERAAAELGLVCIDGFSFTTPRRFDPQFFDFDIVKRNSPSESFSLISGVFRYLKLHGSVDWAERQGQIVVNPDVSSDDACLIYPARMKFQRSYRQPHLELMARYLAALREPNTCLLVIGYGFSDDHLSAPIFAALRANPHFRMICVSRTIDRKVENAQPQSAHSELSVLAQSADLSFVATSFSQFVSLLPDMAALSPAHELEAAVLRVAGKSQHEA